MNITTINCAFEIKKITYLEYPLYDQVHTHVGGAGGVDQLIQLVRLWVQDTGQVAPAQTQEVREGSRGKREAKQQVF